jgi:nicotinamidase-related amidase
MKTLIVVDMQNDFITGPLGTPEAQAIVPKVKAKIEEYRKRGEKIIFTRDTHFGDYLETLEGKYLPVKHCIVGTHGWQIPSDLISYEDERVNKCTFGYDQWHLNQFRNDHNDITDEIELVGLCTDICVVSNALILKAVLPQICNIEITVDASCCAGTTPENHKAALQVMKSCQINVIGE